MQVFLICGLVVPGGPGYEVVHGWPQLPDGFAFLEVSGVDVDSHNCVYVFHRGDPPIFRFEGDSGKVLDSWGDGLFTTAHGLTVDDQDNVWVTDADQHQVFKFGHDGKLLMVLGEKDVPGLDGGHFNKPTDVAVAATGEFFVADGYGNSRVAKFSARGEFMSDWGTKGSGPGEFRLPHGIDIDARGRVYVADRGNARIQIFDENGKFLHQWKSEDLGRPWGLDVAPDGYLYVVDGGDLLAEPSTRERNRALKLDLEGNILATWGSFGSYDGQFYWAHDVAGGKQGEVYVTDVYLGMRVQKFVPSGSTLRYSAGGR
jgi:peptidylamidoglycolate lyase